MVTISIAPSEHWASNTYILQEWGCTTTIISAYFNEGRRYDVTSEHVSSALKLAAGALV
jgi:hypothetical protein